MKRKSILTIACTVLFTLVQAQDKSEKSFSINASYFSINATNPGFKAGVERAFIVIPKTNKKKNGNEKTITNTLYYCGNIGFYNLPELRNTVFFDFGVGFRHIGNKNLITGIELGFWTGRTYNSGKTYEVDDTGEVDEVPYAGYNNYAFTLNS